MVLCSSHQETFTFSGVPCSVKFGEIPFCPQSFPIGVQERCLMRGDSPVQNQQNGRL